MLGELTSAFQAPDRGPRQLGAVTHWREPQKLQRRHSVSTRIWRGRDAGRRARCVRGGWATTIQRLTLTTPLVLMGSSLMLTSAVVG